MFSATIPPSLPHTRAPAPAHISRPFDHAVYRCARRIGGQPKAPPRGHTRQTCRSTSATPPQARRARTARGPRTLAHAQVRLLMLKSKDKAATRRQKHTTIRCTHSVAHTSVDRSFSRAAAAMAIGLHKAGAGLEGACFGAARRRPVTRARPPRPHRSWRGPLPGPWPLSL